MARNSMDVSGRTKVFGSGLVKEAAEVLGEEKARELAVLCSKHAARAAGALVEIMPEARGAWLFGPEDWTLRGHAVVSVGVLMTSTVERLLDRTGGASFVFPEGASDLLPTVVPITHKIGASIPAVVDANSRNRLLRVLSSSQVRQAFGTLDEKDTMVVDARSQVMLVDAGLIRPVNSSQGTVWQLTQRPISRQALLSIKDWYRKAVEMAVREMGPVLETVQDVDASLKCAALLIATGQAGARIPVPGLHQTRPGGLIARLGGFLSGGSARLPGLSLWADPWGVWDTCRQLGKIA